MANVTGSPTNDVDSERMPGAKRVYPHYVLPPFDEIQDGTELLCHLGFTVPVIHRALYLLQRLSEEHGADLPAQLVPRLLANPHLARHAIVQNVLHDPTDFRYVHIGATIQSSTHDALIGRLMSDIWYQKFPSTIWQLHSFAVTTASTVLSHIPYMGSDSRIRSVEVMVVPMHLGGKVTTLVIFLGYVRKATYGSAGHASLSGLD